MRLTLSIASLVCLLPGAHAQKVAAGPSSNLRYTANGEIVVSMVFPVLGGGRWSDTYGKILASGKQQGQNIPAAKMRPLLACFDGVWTGQGIKGDNGFFASYGNLNNDTPGTDDGLAKDEYIYAPGIRPGIRVYAGQHIAYCGDSSAEEEKPYLHFELSWNGEGTINPAASLNAASVLTKPKYSPARPEVKPVGSQLRLDGEVVSVDVPRGVASVRVAAWMKAKNKISAQASPVRRWVRIEGPSLQGKLRKLALGDFIAVVGKDPGRDRPVVAKEILSLQVGKGTQQVSVAAEKPKAKPKKPVVTASHSGFSQENNSAEGEPNATEVGTISLDPEDVPPPIPVMPRIEVLADFESGYYQGWDIIGNCWGRTVDGVAIAGSTVRGWRGQYFLTSARAMPGSRNIESGTGRARSAAFVIPEDASEIRFMVAGGNYPGRCCLNLLVDDEVVRTATGENPYRFHVGIWDVTELRGKTVRLEIRDSMPVGVHAYIHVDDIVLVRGPAEYLPKDKTYMASPDGVPQTAPLPFQPGQDWPAEGVQLP